MISLKVAKRRLREFSARGSNCPICKKGFRYGCNHSVTQAYERMEDDILNAKIEKALKKKGLI